MKNTHFQIIYLNGPSSSGKTTLAKKLQDAFEEPFLHIGIDKIIGWMPEKYNDWTGEQQQTLGYSWKKSSDHTGALIQEIQIGPYAEKIGEIFQEVILTLAKIGHCIIIDDVSEKQGVARWKQLLKDFPVLWVGVHAPLSVLEKREQERKNRMIGSARAQFHKVHLDTAYDIEIDTHKTTFDETFKRIISFPSHHKGPCTQISRIGVYGIVKKNNSLLLITQKTGPYANCFDFPGGKVEFGESPEETLRREFLEEVGMDFESMDLMTNLSTCITVPEKPSYTFHHIGLIYIVNGLTRVTGNQTALEYTWVDIDALEEHTVSPFVWKIILLLKKGLNLT